MVYAYTIKQILSRLLNADLAEVAYVLHMVTPFLDLSQFSKSRIIQQAELSFFNPSPLSAEEIIEQYFGLAVRESECLFYLARGKTLLQTAEYLGLSERTIATHFENIKQRFDCDSRSQMVQMAINLGFVNIIPQSLLDAAIDREHDIDS